MKLKRTTLVAYGLAVAIILVDQATKAWMLYGLSLREVGRVLVWPPVFNLTFVLNDGVSFGLLGGGAGRWALSVFSIVVAAALAWWATRVDRRFLVLAVGLVMGGAIGNVIDRIRFGGVVDFLDFSGTGLFPWIFNVADSAITVGVVLLLIDSLVPDRRPAVGAVPEKS